MDFRGFQQDLRARTVPNVLDFAARTNGERRFLRESGASDWLSFADAHRRSHALARGLARLGVQHGDFVPLMLSNCPDFVLAWFAINLRGAAYIGVNTSLIGDLLASQFAMGRARVWVVGSEHLPAVERLSSELRATVETLVVVGEPASAPQGWRNVVAFGDLAEEGPDASVPVGFLDIAAVGFTSGTTGPSKGVASTQCQSVSSALSFMRVVDLQADDVIYTPLPLFHGMSSRMGMLPAMLLGCPIVLGRRFSGSRFWADAIEAEATVAQIIFSIPNVLLAQPSGPQDRAHRVRRMFNAHHTDAFFQRFGVQLAECFGISEVGLFIASPLAEQRAGSAGRVHPDWEVQIQDAQGFALPDGEAGEIVCRPKLPGLMMRGYLNQPDRTVEATRDLWYHTGDIARRDGDGYYWFLDRAKERIRRRGENISSMEVEDAVRAHADVADVAALAHPARAGEDDIRMLIVPQPERTIDPQALHAWMAGRLPRYMVPRYIEVVPSLPYTATNKVEKSKLMAAGLAPHAWDAEAAHGA